MKANVKSLIAVICFFIVLFATASLCFLPRDVMVIAGATGNLFLIEILFSFLYFINFILMIIVITGAKKEAEITP